MAKTDRESVARYIAKQPKHVRPVLSRVRKLVQGAVPGLEEGISYQIPVYKLDGELVIYFAGWTEHYALYPALDVASAFAKELMPYDVSKGTIRFPLDDVPAKLITRIVKFRAQLARERSEAKLERKARSKRPAKSKARGKSPVKSKAPKRRAAR